VKESPLPRLFLAVYVLLVAYASLYPLSGWRDPGAPALAFLSSSWPRWVTPFDVVANVLGYVPFGALCALALHPRLRGFPAALVAVVCAAALSIALEAAQGFLPSRVASNLDVLANASGALAGGIAGVLAAPWLLGQGPLKRFRADAFAPGAEADLGLTLIGLWLFAQLNPAALLFGVGDLRDLFADPEGPAHAAQLFVSVEAFTAASNLVAVSLLASVVVRRSAPVRALLLGVLLAALAVKTLAFAILLRAERTFAWLTPGAQLGLVIGIAVMLAAVALPRTVRLALAAVLLMAATVFVNLSPPNPYTAAMLKVWEQGHFLNFNGLTRLVSASWPFAALAYLILLASRGGSEHALG
jgi:VanZ family protein